MPGSSFSLLCFTDGDRMVNLTTVVALWKKKKLRCKLSLFQAIVHMKKHFSTAQFYKVNVYFDFVPGHYARKEANFHCKFYRVKTHADFIPGHSAFKEAHFHC